MGSNITEILREKGFKVTPQRLAIYKILMETSKHPTAEVIFGELQSQYPTMSLATVYKTIEVLKEMGLVSSLNVGEDSFRYDANMEPHIHMICQECNEVTDLFGMDLSALNAAAEEKSELSEVLSDSQLDIVENEGEYIIKFKALEIFIEAKKFCEEKIYNFINSVFEHINENYELDFKLAELIQKFFN